MATSFLLTVALVICLCAGYSAAIKCYACPMDDTTCRDPFDTRNRTLVDNCTQCMKTKGEQYDKIVERSCVTDVLVDSNCKKDKKWDVDVTICRCSSDKCNGALSSYFTMATILSPLLMFATHVL
ncbi:uncharacterized protein LOC127847531 [Dreissena polymorpha]|uniref:Protein quiver n=1 Tax=Dreissena polymorpha TaxID=45954 RepID=A0A9D4DPE0_DREPO|nr:uncharacterized protein LOC127847531 [Dreissena polymorpha]KAH3751294.1 hypothetical protein DPMN_185847 [Dreissena polymorpha]